MIHFPNINIEQMPRYQEIFAKGFHDGEYKKALQIVLKQLKHCFGELGKSQENHIKILSGEQLDVLAEYLLDFKSSDDLTHWLNSNTKVLNES